MEQHCNVTSKSTLFRKTKQEDALLSDAYWWEVKKPSDKVIIQQQLLYYKMLKSIMEDLYLLITSA
jgi:hypothetical protein